MLNALQAALTQKLGARAPEEKEEKGYFDHVIRLKPDGQAVVVFMVPLKMIPSGLQVVEAAARGAATKSETTREKRSFSRIDMESFLKCSVLSVNILSYGPMARVFVNVEVNAKHPGFNFWGEGRYGELLTMLFGYTYERGFVFFNENKPSINLEGRRRERRADDVEFFFELS